MEIIIKQIGEGNVSDEDIRNMVSSILSNLGFNSINVTIIHQGNNAVIGKRLWASNILESK